MKDYKQRGKKISTTIYLYSDQLEKLKKISENSGAPVALLIRRAIDNFLAVKNKKVVGVSCKQEEQIDKKVEEVSCKQEEQIDKKVEEVSCKQEEQIDKN